jgi:8-oxo-dGTP pyrophosphatase MutT (NUDIX family)
VSDTQIRRAFSVAIYVRRGGVGGEVLMIKHRRLGHWLPVGGEMEPGETPLEAAVREMGEETGLAGLFSPLVDHADGVPHGYIGYEEHIAGSKGLHMNFVFVCDVPETVEVSPNHEFDEHRWLGLDGLAELTGPVNVREFGVLAINARPR